MTLAKTARRWKPAIPGTDLTISPGERGFNYTAIADNHTIAVEIGPDGLVVKPAEFVLAWTAETIELPAQHGIAARVEGKSSLGRIGISVHVTAPTIHAGFKGSIQLEVYNHAPNPVRLTAGMKICQLIFELTLGTPNKAYSGQFIGQTSR